jgi:hypothetical protein
MGFIVRPSAMQCRCVHSRTNLSSSFDLGLPHPGFVPSLPFLPASTVSSAAGNVPCGTSPLASRGFVAPRSRPWGSPCFRVPVRDPKIAPAPFLDGATPFEAFPSPTGGRPSPRLPAFTDRPCPLAVSTTSGLCSAGESVVAACRCRPAPPDAPMGFCADPCSVSHRPGRNPGVVVIAAA